LPSLLLEMMAMDSDKHARVLQFVERRLAARARAEGGAVEEHGLPSPAPAVPAAH
jgi:hypothetical protein